VYVPYYGDSGRKYVMIRIKSEKDIAGIRESSHILADTLNALQKMIEPGVSTQELDRFAKSYVEKQGARPAFLNYMGFPASVCISVNHVVIHGIPGKQKLKEGDIVSLDFGVDLHGYFSDAAKTYPVGKISTEAMNLLTVTEESLYRGIEQAVAGNRIRDISRAVSGYVEPYGYGVVYQFCGHGVGFAPHEDPQIPNYVSSGPNPKLRAGMVIAIEPMINLGIDEVVILDDGWTVETADKKISAHFEHTVAIFEDHSEILTSLN